MVRTPSVDKNGIRRGAWSEEEDNILKAYILKNGHSNWRQLPRFAGLARCGKSCRLRWKNYLKPGLRRGNYTKEEVEQIIKLREEFGNKWSLIASTMPGRTDNEIKNYWHTHLKNPTKQGPKSIISTHKNVENLDQMHVIDCMEQISSSMSLSHESIQMKEFDTNSKAVDSFPEVSSSMNCNSSSFEHWDYSIDSFPAFEEFWHQPFLFNTSNDIITQSVADPRFWTEPFILDSSNSQISDSSIYNLGLNDESVARNFGSFVSESQILPSTSCNSALLSGVEHWSSWTQPILMDTSSNDSIFSTAISNSEECMAPFMPLATGDTWLDRELILNPGYYQEMQWSLPLDPLPDDMDLINL